ncbi:MAG TPA: adenylate cyclase [Acidimicrobiia bacterium]|nr:adenylate cyclase [Acidimicrobiia bacterium]
MTSVGNDVLTELMAVIGGSDSVELKLTVPDSHHRSTADALDLDPVRAEIRQVVFFDTPDLALNQAGLVVRARRMPGDLADTVVKLRPVVPDQIPEDLRRSGKVSVELDAMPGGHVCSASMKGKADAAAVRRVMRGEDRTGSLFSKGQKGFFETHAPAGLRMRDLSALGPINILKLKFSPPDLGRKMVAELWLYPNGGRILELSTKCAPGEAFQVAAEARAFLLSRGVDLDGEQQTKTKTALEFFSAALGDGDARTGDPAP